MPMMEYGGGGKSMIENWPHCWEYTSAYYKGCDILLSKEELNNGK